MFKQLFKPTIEGRFWAIPVTEGFLTVLICAIHQTFLSCWCYKWPHKKSCTRCAFYCMCLHSKKQKIIKRLLPGKVKTEKTSLMSLRPWIACIYWLVYSLNSRTGVGAGELGGGKPKQIRKLCFTRWVTNSKLITPQ